MESLGIPQRARIECTITVLLMCVVASAGQRTTTPAAQPGARQKRILGHSLFPQTIAPEGSVRIVLPN